MYSYRQASKREVPQGSWGYSNHINMLPVAFIPDYLNPQMGVDGKKEGEFLGERWKRSTGDEVQPDL